MDWKKKQDCLFYTTSLYLTIFPFPDDTSYSQQFCESLLILWIFNANGHPVTTHKKQLQKWTKMQRHENSWQLINNNK